MSYFRPDQLTALGANLSQDVVKKRDQAGRKLSYIEAWHAIAEANRIFGFDGWARETVDTKCVSERAREIGQQKRPGWGVSYVCRVRVTIGDIVRDGTGAGHGIDTDLGLAHESAIKEAESDAMKRALMTFGNPFGLALYDKQQRHVGDDPEAPANDGKPAISEQAPRPAPGKSIQEVARDKAREGGKAFNKWWNTLSRNNQDALETIAGELFAIGEAADKANLLRA